MWDIASITQWASENGKCLFLRTDDGQYYALSRTSNDEIHFVPLTLTMAEVVEEAQDQDTSQFIIAGLTHSDSAQDLLDQVRNHPDLGNQEERILLSEASKVLFASEARALAWGNIHDWFEDGIFEDAATHYLELTEDMGVLLNDDEVNNPASWTEEDLHRYQYLYLPAIGRLYGTYEINTDHFTEVKPVTSSLVNDFSLLYSPYSFLLIANENGEPTIHPIRSSEYDIQELLQVGDWVTLVESASEEPLYLQRIT